MYQNTWSLHWYNLVNGFQPLCLTTGMFSIGDKHAEADSSFNDDDELNEAEVNGNWTPQEKALHEARLKAKAKRRLRKSSSRNSTSESFSESGDLAGTDPHSPKGKVNTNDRKSRTGKGRGLPKKGNCKKCWMLRVERGNKLIMSCKDVLLCMSCTEWVCDASFWAKH